MKPHTAQDRPAWISSRSQKPRPLSPAALLPSPAAVHFSGLSRAHHPPGPWAGPFDQMALIRVLFQSCCSTIVIILNIQLFFNFRDYSAIFPISIWSDTNALFGLRPPKTGFSPVIPLPPSLRNPLFF
jgi:hypothetical protein